MIFAFRMNRMMAVGMKGKSVNWNHRHNDNHEMMVKRCYSLQKLHVLTCWSLESRVQQRYLLNLSDAAADVCFSVIIINIIAITINPNLLYVKDMTGLFIKSQTYTHSFSCVILTFIHITVWLFIASFLHHHPHQIYTLSSCNFDHLSPPVLDLAENGKLVCLWFWF